MVKETVPSKGGNAIDPTHGLKRFSLVEALRGEVRAHEYIKTKYISPHGGAMRRSINSDLASATMAL
jgi:hypothetical protein